MATADYVWTAEDAEAIHCAIMTKAAGKRVLVNQLTESTMQYADASLKDLTELYDRIAASIAVPATTQATRRPMVYRSHYSKGL